MPPAGLSDLPVELSERILECLDVLDILQLKLAASRSRTESLIVHLVTQINLSISRHLSFRPYRVKPFLVGLEDGNHYSLANRQQFFRIYQSDWSGPTS